MNAAIQVLANTRLYNAMKSVYYSEPPLTSEGKRLVYSFAKLVTMVNSRQYETIKPLEFFSRLCDVVGMYKKKKQQDTQEFIRILLDTVNSEVQDVNQLFKGFLETRISCNSCTYVSTVAEPFLDLSLQIPDDKVTDDSKLSLIDQYVIDAVSKSWSNLFTKRSNITLYDCLASYFHQERIEIETSSCCGRPTILTRSPRIAEFPQYLTIVLKRFTHGNWLSNKITKYVHYPLELQLEGATYRLHGLITHSGLLASRGHYRAIVNLEEGWAEFDDHRTRKLRDLQAEVMGKEAYLLLYELR